MISGQAETIGINLVDSQDLRWIPTSLLHSRAHQYATAKVYVSSDSVLYLGGMGDDPNQSWKNKIKWYSETNYFSELNRIMESRWSSSGIFSQDSRQRQSSKKFRIRWASYSVIQRTSKTRSSSTLNGKQEEMKKSVAEYARQFPRGHWSFLGPGSEKVVRNLRWHTKWTLDANSGENATEL